MNNEILKELDELEQHLSDPDHIESIQSIKKNVQRQEKILMREDARKQSEYNLLHKKLEEIDDLRFELNQTQRDIIFRINLVAETYSNEISKRGIAVAEYAQLLAKLFGLDGDDRTLLFYATPVYDIGKIAIPEAILNKPGQLEHNEKALIQNHTLKGFEILNGSNNPILNLAATIAHEHHENWDGSGYPNGLTGDEVSIFVRIVSLADAFYELSSEQPYKKALDNAQICSLIKSQSGISFDPMLVDLFLEHFHEFLEIRERFNSTNND